MNRKATSESEFAVKVSDAATSKAVLDSLETTKPLGEGVEDVKKLESELKLPDGVVSIFTGSADMMAESFASILFFLFMAVVLTYMILAAQFESFLHPFTIMLSLPLSVGGALGSLFLLGRTLNIFSMIGMVMLMGLVTRNAILLVDYTNLLRSRGIGKTGSSTNEVRGEICASNVLALIDDVSAATEPERLAHISLGQENPRMRMNVAPG